MKRQVRRKYGFGIALLILAACCAVWGGCGRKSRDAQVRVGALKGPTTIGLLQLMAEAEAGNTEDTYAFTMAVGADELTPLLAKGELDIALLPANVAAVLYQRMESGIRVLDINTLGVLYVVSQNGDIGSMQDLRGRTIYLTGRGTTPDYVLQYLLEKHGIAQEEVTLDYRAEAVEVAALLAENPDAAGLLPQPFATAACAQNKALSVRLSLTEEWDRVQGENGSRLVTGVTVVRTEFLAENPEAVARFLEAHAVSAAYAQEQTAETAALCVKAEIIAREEVAEKAVPLCNIACITGEEMQQALSGYLSVLYELNPEAVGGSLPDNAFYYK